MTFQQPLGRQFHLLSKIYLGVFAHKLSHLDLERHFYILTLLNNDKEINQKDIAEHLDVDKVTMSRMIDYLVKKKYVLRKASSTDRRAFSLKLTIKGQKAVPEILQAIEEVNNAALAGVSEKEKVCFFKIFNKINSNLNQLPANRVQFNFKTITAKKKKNQ